MRSLLLLLAVVLAGCGQAGAGSGAPSADAQQVVSDRGVSLTIPDGWSGVALRGRVQVRDYTGAGDPAAGHVEAFLDELSTAFDNSGYPYPDLSGALAIQPGTYPSPEFAVEAEPGPHLAGAARFFTDAGRRFELLVVYGGDEPPDATVAALNGVLATLRVQPGDFYDTTVAPPSFAPAGGWYVGGDGPTRERPEGDQLCAWASTMPYRDPQACPIPAFTIDQLPPDGMVISVDAYRSWQPLSGDPLPGALVLPAQLGPVQEGGRRSFDISGTVDDTYQVDVSVYVADGATPTPAMRERAQAMLDGLHLPTWPS